MKVGIHIDRSVEEIEVLITAQERNRKVDALYQHIVEFDKSRLETLTAYRDDIAKIVNVADIFRIYTGNQKVYIQTHQEVIPEKDSLKLVKKEAENYYKQHSLDECFATGLELYQSENFQIQEVGVFLVGYAACKNTSALSFLKDTVSQHKSWKVQEILAMAFDNYCKIIGYETAIPVIKEWLKSDCANTRRAVSEGLRIWTSRPYFKEHPQMAIQFLSSLKDDESEYVRKSIGNALKDISKKYPELVSNELKQWDLSSKEIKQVHKLASAYLNKS